MAMSGDERVDRHLQKEERGHGIDETHKQPPGEELREEGVEAEDAAQDAPASSDDVEAPSAVLRRQPERREDFGGNLLVGEEDEAPAPISTTRPSRESRTHAARSIEEQIIRRTDLQRKLTPSAGTLARALFERFARESSTCAEL